MNEIPVKMAVVVTLAMATAICVVALPDRAQRRRGAACFLGWIVPGAGHMMLGRYRKGLFFFLVLAAAYLFGLWICGWRAVSWDDNPFYYLGQFGSGLAMLMGQLLSAEKAFPRPDLPVSWYEVGLLYVCVAGLLNLVVTLGVLDVSPAAPRKEEPAEAPPQEPA